MNIKEIMESGKPEYKWIVNPENKDKPYLAMILDGGMSDALQMLIFDPSHRDEWGVFRLNTVPRDYKPGTTMENLEYVFRMFDTEEEAEAFRVNEIKQRYRIDE